MNMVGIKRHSFMISIIAPSVTIFPSQKSEGEGTSKQQPAVVSYLFEYCPCAFSFFMNKIIFVPASVCGVHWWSAYIYQRSGVNECKCIPMLCLSLFFLDKFSHAHYIDAQYHVLRSEIRREWPPGDCVCEKQVYGRSGNITLFTFIHRHAVDMFLVKYFLSEI